MASINKCKHLLVLLFGLWSGLLCAQKIDVNTVTTDADTIQNYSAFKRSLVFGGLLQTRAVLSLTKNVDVNGNNFAEGTKGVTNNFLVKRARLKAKATVNDHFSANFLINFADFNNDPTNKVLENAYAEYTLNKHFHVNAGQFRPYFGTEDLYPADLIRSFDYSNQYTAFGANGWQSFQIGLSVYGDITDSEKGQIPIRYYTGIYNGNNRNKSIDNDNGKNFYTRFEVEATKRTKIGINGAVGSNGNGRGSAWGADFDTNFKLSDKFNFLIGGEYKNGTNFNLFNSAPVPGPSLSQYRMQGFYLFPVLQYHYKRPRIRSIELSSRYEYFDEDYKLSRNPRHTIIPNVSFVFADNYYAMLQIGMTIDVYKDNVPLTSTYNSNMAYIQLQLRF